MEVCLQTPPSFAPPLGKMIAAAIPILSVHDSQQQNSATANWSIQHQQTQKHQTQQHNNDNNTKLFRVGSNIWQMR
jgi:hypothetical protein